MSIANATAIRNAARRAAEDLGVAVVERRGFVTRGHSNDLSIRSTMWHDTVTGTNVSPARLWELLADGYVGLRGPIANVGLERDGTLGLIAARRAHHAGSGSTFLGVSSGNRQTVGLEVANRGRGSGERWTGAQYDVAVAFTAYLADEVRRARGESMLGHLEWARRRKVDPWAPDLVRARVTIAGYRAPRRDYLTTGDSGSEVRAWQRDLLAAGFELPRYGADGDFGAETAAASVAFLRAVGLGVSDPDRPRIGSRSRAAMVDLLANPPEPPDPIEEYLVSLPTARRAALDKLSRIPDDELDELLDLLGAIKRRESSGRGVVNATVDDHRQRGESGFEPAHYTILARAIREAEDLDSNIASAIRVGLAVIREARARGWHADPVRFAANRRYGPEDLDDGPTDPLPLVDALAGDGLAEDEPHGPEEAADENDDEG